MGMYVNPPGGSKEDFLRKYGEPVGAVQVQEFQYPEVDVLPVVLVNNGCFTAAGVMYSARERDAWLADRGDTRPKSFYLVPVSALKDEGKSGIRTSEWR